MVMNEENVKERLIQATMDLLKKEKSAKKLTARKIAETADANPILFPARYSFSIY